MKTKQIVKINDKLHALGEDGLIYKFNPAAELNCDGEWELSGINTSDFRFWIPLPELEKSE